jgi:hypothetical protein
LHDIKTARAAQLEGAGIKTPAQLCVAVHQKSTLEDLAQKTGLSASLLEETIKKSRKRWFQNYKVTGLLGLAGLIGTLISVIAYIDANKSGKQLSHQVQELQSQQTKSERTLQRNTLILSALGKTLTDSSVIFMQEDRRELPQFKIPITSQLFVTDVPLNVPAIRLIQSKDKFFLFDGLAQHLFPIPELEDRLRTLEDDAPNARVEAYQFDLVSLASRDGDWKEQAENEVIIQIFYGAGERTRDLLILYSDPEEGWRTILDENLGDPVYQFADLDGDAQTEIVVGRRIEEAVAGFRLFRWDGSLYQEDKNFDWRLLQPGSPLQKAIEEMQNWSN